MDQSSTPLFGRFCEFLGFSRKPSFHEVLRFLSIAQSKQKRQTWHIGRREEVRKTRQSIPRNEDSLHCFKAELVGGIFGVLVSRTKWIHIGF